MPKTVAALEVDVRVGARLDVILVAFDLLRAALASHGHVWTEDEQAALDHAARMLEDALDVEPR